MALQLGAGSYDPFPHPRYHFAPLDPHACPVQAVTATTSSCVQQACLVQITRFTRHPPQSLALPVSLPPLSG